MEFTNYKNSGPEQADAMITLDAYEVVILVSALEQHIALTKIDVNRETDRLKQHEADWRNSPDLREMEEREG